jgi:AraC-like DNA-binding protein
MQHCFRYILLLLMTAMQINVFGAKQPNNYQALMNLPSEKLLQMGRYYGDMPDKPDSALLYLSILTSRYDKSLSKKEKILCIRGFSAKCFVYFFLYYDYSKAYQCLVKAQEISDEIGVEIPRIYLNFGHLYSTIGEQSKDKKTCIKSIYYFKKAFYIALKEKDHNILNMAFGNIVSVANDNGVLDKVKKEWDIYKKIKNTDMPEFTKFNILLYQGYYLKNEKKYAEALKIFEKQKALMTVDVSHVRYICISLFNEAEIYAMQGQYVKAIDCMQKIEVLGRKFDMKDVLVTTFETMAKYYDHLHKSTFSEEYRNKFYSLKDSLLNYRQVESMNEIKFDSEIKKMDERIADMKHKREIVSIVSFILSVAVVVVVIFLYILSRKNKQLHLSNKLLYQKNVEILDEDKEYRRRREEDAETRQRLESRISELENSSSTKTDKTEAAKTESERQNRAYKKDEEKYKGSSLDETMKSELLNRIQNVMETDDEIYSVDFSADRLTALVDSNSQYVSQVINEKYNCNFNNLLNKYRIKEACKRMNESGDNLTIEAISYSVGFKSRSTFVISFKRVTGLTPSEYLRLAKSEK